MAASNEQIQAILNHVAAGHLPVIDPLVAGLFDCEARPSTLPTVTMHKWVVAPVEASDDAKSIRDLAKSAIAEMSGTSAKIAMELVFSATRFLPQLPLWTDGSQLFHRQSAIDGSHRFGVEGGNVVESVDCFASDVETAVDRLIQLDANGAYDSDEPLMIFCSKRLERRLIRAAVRVSQKCAVTGIDSYRGDSWILIGAKSPCGMEIRRPTYQLGGSGTRIVVGARFTTWIADPRLVIRVEPPQERT